MAPRRLYRERQVEMLRRFFDMLFHRLFFTLMYRRGFTPWDTGISPPELVDAVEGTNSDAAGARP